MRWVVLRTANLSIQGCKDEMDEMEGITDKTASPVQLGFITQSRPNTCRRIHRLREVYEEFDLDADPHSSWIFVFTGRRDVDMEECFIERVGRYCSSISIGRIRSSAVEEATG